MGVLTALRIVPKVLQHGGNKVIFVLRKTKPQILVVGGAIIVVGSFIWAIHNARKIDEVMSESQAEVDDIQEQLKLAEEEGNKEQISKLCKDLKKAKVKAIYRMFCLMGIPCILFAGGICFIIGGHMILFKRFGEVSAAFAALQQTFDRYRQMNIAEHGEECDRRYRYGIEETNEVTEKITDDEGNEKEVKCLVPVVDKDKAASMYTFIFSPETSHRCPKDPVNIISFLKSQEKYWNVWMQSTGKPVTLSMVLEDLGIDLDPDDPRNDYILIAGWRPNGDGDGHIDYGIMRAINKGVIDMQDNCVVLNFNCDGNIYHSNRYDKHGNSLVKGKKSIKEVK